MRRHIRMQQSANPIINALSIRDTYNTLNHSTHLISFSSRSASHPSPSSPSGPYGVGSVSSRTIAGNSPCARTARSVSGAVSVDVGSATIDAWELGCTVAPDCAGPPCILVPGARVVAARAEGMRRLLRRNAALRRTAISESESARITISLKVQMSEWTGIRYLRMLRVVRPIHLLPRTGRLQRRCASRGRRACISLWSGAAWTTVPRGRGRTEW
jgi:hypothetical protein